MSKVQLTIKSISVEKKLSVNYNSVGMNIGADISCDPEITTEEAVQGIKEARFILEQVLDEMLVDSVTKLPKLQEKVKGS